MASVSRRIPTSNIIDNHMNEPEYVVSLWSAQVYEPFTCLPMYIIIRHCLFVCAVMIIRLSFLNENIVRLFGACLTLALTSLEGIDWSSVELLTKVSILVDN